MSLNDSFLKKSLVNFSFPAYFFPVCTKSRVQMWMKQKYWSLPLAWRFYPAQIWKKPLGYLQNSPKLFLSQKMLISIYPSPKKIPFAHKQHPSLQFKNLHLSIMALMGKVIMNLHFYTFISNSFVCLFNLYISRICFYFMFPVRHKGFLIYSGGNSCLDKKPSALCSKVTLLEMVSLTLKVLLNSYASKST